MKNHINIIKKLVGSICVIIQIFLFVGMPSIAYSAEFLETSSEVVSLSDTSNNISKTSSSSEGIASFPEITYSITNPINPTLPTTTITFDKTNIDSFILNTSGLEITDDFIDETANTASYVITATDDFGALEVVAQVNGATVTTKTIYTYCNDNSIYTSEVSNDTAWHKCKQYEYDNYKLTSENWHRQYSEISLLFTKNETDYSFTDNTEANEAVNNGKVVVRGRMTWETKYGNVLPMRCTKVELRKWHETGSCCIATAYTNLDGYYRFIFDPDDWNILPGVGLKLFVRTCVESDTFIVMQPYFEEFNYFDSPTFSNVTGETGIINVSRRITNDINFLPYQLTYIQQGMVVGERFAFDMRMISDKKLFVIYIGGTDLTDNITDPYVTEFINTIYDNAFCYDTFSFIGYRQYDNFFTTIHEYGHYVENRMGNYGSAVKEHIDKIWPDEFTGKFEQLLMPIKGLDQVLEDYSHDPKINNFSRTSPLTLGKDFQMELTWSEAWATAFAKIAYQYYISEYEGVQFNTELDYESGSASSFDGEAQEYAVASFLWDIYDSAPEGATDDDDMSMTAEEWWAITTKAETYTLQDLTTNILENYPELIEDVGEILSNHNISPGSLAMVGSPCVDGQLNLVWDANGSSSFPNDKFRIVFYDDDNNKIGEVTTKIESVPTVSSPYCVPTDVWEDVMENYEFGKTIYAVVYGYRSGEFDSGPYFSTYLKILDKETEHNYTNKSYNSTHHWNVCACGVSSDEKSEHSATYSYYTPTQHYRQCSGCGYQTHEDHEYDIVSSVTDEGHIFACVCGVSMSFEEHYEHSYERYNSVRHYVTCECGYQIRTARHIVPAEGTGYKLCIYCGERIDSLIDITPVPGTNSTGGITYITEAGSYVDSDGVIYLVESDMRLYLDGRLDVYALVDALYNITTK